MAGAPPDRQTLLGNLARRLSAFGPLDASELAAVEGLAGEAVTLARGADVACLDTRAPYFVMAGWACQMRPHPTRRRQIFGFVLPGDMIGSFWRRPEFTFYRTVALTPLVILSTEGLLAEGPDGPAYPRLLDAARRSEEHLQHRLFDHLVRLGGRDAYGGLAHLLLEFHTRLSQAGLAHDHAFILPIGQRVLAQTMGFSLAHTNHTLQRMSADGLISIRGDVVHLLDPSRLAALADEPWPDVTSIDIGIPEKPSPSLVSNYRRRIECSRNVAPPGGNHARRPRPRAKRQGPRPNRISQSKTPLAQPWFLAGPIYIGMYDVFRNYNVDVLLGLRVDDLSNLGIMRAMWCLPESSKPRRLRK